MSGQQPPAGFGVPEHRIAYDHAEGGWYAARVRGGAEERLSGVITKRAALAATQAAQLRCALDDARARLKAAPVRTPERRRAVLRAERALKAAEERAEG